MDTATLTIDNLSRCGWEDPVLGSQSYLDMYFRLEEASEQTKVVDPPSSAMLGLLAKASSLHLVSHSANAPFKPFDGAPNARRLFLKPEVEFFAVAFAHLSEGRIRARIADLAWLMNKPRYPAHALAALDAYVELPLNWDSWMEDGSDCWERAVSLAHTIGEPALSRLKTMDERLSSALLSSKALDGIFSVRIADVMFRYGLGREITAQVSSHLVNLGREIGAQGDFLRARAYLQMATKWIERESDRHGAAGILCEIAESWVAETDSRIFGGARSHMVAGDLIKSAIETYRSIPRASRVRMNVDERINQLRDKLAVVAERSMEEFGSMQTRGIDISDLVDHARKAVADKPLMEALAAFTALYTGPAADSLNAAVVDNMRHFSLASIFSAQIMANDGRVVAKVPGLDSATGSEQDLAIKHAMIRDFSLTVVLFVQGQVLPALNILIAQHRLSILDFVHLANESHLISRDRVELFARALYAGYERNFVTCIHLLTPQIEHLVRVHLKLAGAKTTYLAKNGVETENGLSSLLESPEAEVAFGKNVVFELQAIYCDPTGPNLRNQIAHGLLTEDECNSAPVIYAWWMALRLLFHAFRALRPGH